MSAGETRSRPDTWRRSVRRLMELRGEGFQLAQYLAVLSRLKRSIDDWIPVSIFELYREEIARLGLALEIDCVFEPIPDPGRVFGLDWAPTTRATGRPYRPGEDYRPESQVHAVVAGRSEWAAEALSLAWYPLVLGGRVIYRPHVDFARFGDALGYPRCCVQFFMEHNDWPRQNTMAEALRRSQELSWKANCLTKNSPWMLIFHMPCSFDCAPTREYSSNLLREIESFDAACAERIEGLARGLFLVVNERLVYRFAGGRPHGDGTLGYTAPESLHQHVAIQDPEQRGLETLLARGDRMSVRYGVVQVWNGGELVGALETRCDRGVANVPLLLDFARGERVTPAA